MGNNEAGEQEETILTAGSPGETNRSPPGSPLIVLSKMSIMIDQVRNGVLQMTSSMRSEVSSIWNTFEYGAEICQGLTEKNIYRPLVQYPTSQDNASHWEEFSGYAKSPQDLDQHLSSCIVDCKRKGSLVEWHLVKQLVQGWLWNPWTAQSRRIHFRTQQVAVQARQWHQEVARE